MKKIETEEKSNKEEKKSILKEIDKKISTRVFINLLLAILIMLYFSALSIVYKNFFQDRIVDIVKGATLVFLVITLVLIEIAYKKESKRIIIHAFEALALAIHSLTTMYVIKLYGFDFQRYILICSYIFSVYYVLKSIIINTKARRDYLKGLSDIPEIIKKEKPSKKEASKKEREVEQEEEKLDKEEIEPEENTLENNNTTKEYKNEINIEENNTTNDKIANIRAKMEKIREQEKILKEQLANNSEKEKDLSKDDIEEVEAGKKQELIETDKNPELEEKDKKEESQKGKNEKNLEKAEEKQPKKKTATKTTKSVKTNSSSNAKSTPKAKTTRSKKTDSVQKVDKTKETEEKVDKIKESEEKVKESEESPKPRKRGRPKKEVKIND